MKKLLLTLCCLLISALSYAYDFEVDGMYYNITSLQNLTVELTNGDNRYTGDIEIPETVEYSNKTFTVTRLGDNAFSGSSIRSVSIPHTVTEAGIYVFQGCSSLSSITIPSSMTKFGNGCFRSCYNLSNVIFEDGQSTLSLYYNEWQVDNTSYFANCNLKSVYLGRTVSFRTGEEYDGLFWNQSSLKEVVIGPVVTEIGWQEFVKCTSLEKIQIPSNVKRISSKAFSECKKLKDLELNEGLEYIEGNAFKNCSSLEILLLPSTLKTVGDEAFVGCIGLKKVYSKIDQPKDIAESTFAGITYLNAVLYVPTGTKALYEAATGWKDFSSIVETDNFDDLNTYYSFNVSTSVGGKVTVLGNTLSNTSMSASVKEGEDVTLSFKPDEGYELKSVFVNGVDVIGSVENNSYTISAVSQNTTVEVTFVALPVYLTIMSAGNGSIAQEVEKGKVYSFVITPSEGWDIESVSFNGENVTSQLDGNKFTTPAITSDSELNIVYRLNDTNGVNSLKSVSNLKVFASYGKLTIENEGTCTSLLVYSVSGSKVASESVGVGKTTIDLPTNNIYIIKVGKETFKISM